MQILRKYLHITASFWDEAARLKTANEQQIQNVINFAEEQIEKKFQSLWINKNYDPYDEKDPLAKKWYCTELFWPSYYNCNGEMGEGIDIDRNGWVKTDFFVSPNDIRYDDVELLQL